MPKLESGFLGYASEGLASHTYTLIADPPRAVRTYTVISTDDHVVEPPNAFERRLPKAFRRCRPTGLQNPCLH